MPNDPSEPVPGVSVPVAQPVTRTRPAPRYKVFLHNDPITRMEFVTKMRYQDVQI